MDPDIVLDWLEVAMLLRDDEVVIKNIDKSSGQEPEENIDEYLLEKGLADAPEKRLAVDQAVSLILQAETGNFDPSIPKRFCLSPIDPNGPKQFYVVDAKICHDLSNLYNDVDSSKLQSVRVCSSARTHWLSPPMEGAIGLRSRKLVRKERNTGSLLSFGGCVYEIVRANYEGQVTVSSIKLLLVWEL
eukprot:CAMPEP_0203761886 /NCGR_PEP_ID=MMETSP0098-20131031/14882_1 /ASSEMBLY_ACC=CAM_ASM_000208 /TAXON_ID=96639 /ORGANISM=" , Strain NY0313808BC1" /LENGTH=187 /DNA_ID=CAMNT_0050656063 /DNA_START=508 /DNA_END=1071 /DNA_ORIENTATION=+